MMDAKMNETLNAICSSMARLEVMMSNLVHMMEKLDRKLDEALYEPEEETFTGGFDDRRTDSDDEIYKYGQKAPYNKLSGDEVYEFKEFIRYIRMNERQFTLKELDYAGFSDKNFRDVRIADNAKRILDQAYQKIHKKPMPWKFLRGYMYRFNGQTAWEWADGTKD